MSVELVKRPRTLHLEGSAEIEAMAGHARVPLYDLNKKYVVIEEKVDGSDIGFSFNDQAELLLQRRGNLLTYEDHETRDFRVFLRNYESRFFDLLGDRYVVFGEYMLYTHTIFYSNLPAFFLESDVYDRETGLYLTTDQRMRFFKDVRDIVYSVPVLGFYNGLNPEVIRFLMRRSVYVHGDQKKHEAIFATTCRIFGRKPEEIRTNVDVSGLSEGLYVKVEGSDNVVSRYKVVRGEFLRMILEANTHWRYAGNSIMNKGVEV